MDKKIRFKLGIPRIFKSSFASCRSRIFSDATVAVGDQSLFIPETHISDISSSLPESRKLPTDSKSSPLICEPKNPEAQKEAAKSSKSRASGGYLNTHALFYCGEVAASPVSSLVLDREFYQNPRSRDGRKKSRSKRRSPSSSRRYFSTSRRLCRADAAFISSSSDDDVYFSSRSWSSESSKSRNLLSSSRRWSAEDGASATSGCEMMMKDSVAVVKSSSDPYEDFRTSMVEMIVEKQIMSGKDLEKLLQSFLALNSRHHHRVILEVFMEIWEALFCDYS